MSKLEHIREQVEGRIRFFSAKRNENRVRVLGFVVASASLSALATVAIGATKILSLEWLPIIALVSSAVATVVAVWEAVFGYRKLWNINNVALADLYKLKRFIDYKLAGTNELSDDEVDKLFHELDSVLTDADKAWAKADATK
jgi:hypothetical protein